MYLVIQLFSLLFLGPSDCKKIFLRSIDLMSSCLGQYISRTLLILIYVFNLIQTFTDKYFKKTSISIARSIPCIALFPYLSDVGTYYHIIQ